VLYDDHGDERCVSAGEFIAAAGAQLEIISPDRLIGHDAIGTNYPAFMKTLYAADVKLTPDYKLLKVERRAGQLVATFRNDFTKATVERSADQIVYEHGTTPLAEVYTELVEDSTNRGEIDLDALVATQPQNIITNPSGSYQLFRIGDALASRNVAAAFYDARRLTMLL
jgi:hypothetical protein